MTALFEVLQKVEFVVQDQSRTSEDQSKSDEKSWIRKYLFTLPLKKTKVKPCPPLQKTPKSTKTNQPTRKNIKNPLPKNPNRAPKPHATQQYKNKQNKTQKISKQNNNNKPAHPQIKHKKSFRKWEMEKWLRCVVFYALVSRWIAFLSVQCVFEK